jgi:hypothetical protein
VVAVSGTDRVMAIEAALAFMTLLLGMSLFVIVRLPPPAAPRAGSVDDLAGPAASAVDQGVRPLAAGPLGGTLVSPGSSRPSASRPARGRYVPRHGRGRGYQQPPAAGPPWGAAENPRKPR